MFVSGADEGVGRMLTPREPCLTQYSCSSSRAEHLRSLGVLRPRRVLLSDDPYADVHLVKHTLRDAIAAGRNTSVNRDGGPPLARTPVSSSETATGVPPVGSAFGRLRPSPYSSDGPRSRSDHFDTEP